MDDRRRRAVRLGLAIGLLVVAGLVIAWNSGVLGPSAKDPALAEAERRAAELAEQSRAAGFNDEPPAPARPKPEGSGRRPISTGG